MLALQPDTRLRFHPDGAALTPSSAGALPPCRLLVVDDDEWMRVYLASVLRSASYEVDVGDSGREALRLLRSGSYDILLTDYQMPGMDGHTLCQQVRGEFSDVSPYIIMFTVKDTSIDRSAALKSGANEYIIKGAPKSEVLGKLDEGRRICMRNHAFAPWEGAIARPGAAEAEHLTPRSFMDHRWGYRHAVNLPVSFALQSGKLGVGRVLNISTTGAYLQTEMALRIPTLINLTFIDGVGSWGARFTACVTRRDQSGVGLEWEAPIRLPTANAPSMTPVS